MVKYIEDNNLELPDSLNNNIGTPQNDGELLDAYSNTVIKVANEVCDAVVQIKVK